MNGTDLAMNRRETRDLRQQVSYSKTVMGQLALTVKAHPKMMMAAFVIIGVIFVGSALGSLKSQAAEYDEIGMIITIENNI